MRRLLPALPNDLWQASFNATWAACAAITVAYSPAEAQAPRESAIDAAELMARAAAHGDEHVIKLADTVLDVYGVCGDPGALTAVTRCADLIAPPE